MAIPTIPFSDRALLKNIGKANDVLWVLSFIGDERKIIFNYKIFH